MTTPESTDEYSNPRPDIMGRPKQSPRKMGSTTANGDSSDMQGNRREDAEGKLPGPHGRPGDTGVTQPLQKPRKMAPVETAPVPPKTSEVPVEMGKLIQSPEIWAPNFLRIPLVYFGGLLLLSLIGIWLLTAVIELVGNLAALPIWAAYTSTSVLAILLGIVIFLFGSVCFRYFKIPYRPQLVLRQISKSKIVKYGAYMQARNELRKYLQDVDALGRGYIDVLKRMGLEEAGCNKFKVDLAELLRDRAIDGPAWLREYQDNIQSVLDELAKRKQREYANLVGLKTAISPWKAVDLMAVVYNNTMLVRDLCALANRRADRLQSLSILVHVGFNMFIASEAQEFTKNAANKAIEGYGKIADDLVGDGGAEKDIMPEAASALASEGMKAASKFAIAKLGEGLANAWLTQRFGSRVWRLLTPLAE